MKILLIKMGHSETLDPQIGRSTSLGDVLRSTVLLHAYRNDHVTWLTDEKAVPLLENNPLIDRILIWGLDTMLQVQDERFDIVINLEKTPGYCALAERIGAWQRYGFRFNRDRGVAEAYKDSLNALNTYNDLDKKRAASRPWQEVLSEMVDKEWQGEEYVLGYEPKTTPEPGLIGLNYQIGSKWPNKAWPHFDKLAELLEDPDPRLRWRLYSYQPAETTLYDYMDWIHSCELIVTNDSLGLHLAITMKKKVVALFGPTSSHEVHLYGRGWKVVAPNLCEKLPCLESICDYSFPCMKSISVETVMEEIKCLLKN